MSILHKTKNLIVLYMHILGERDDVPKAYHFWTSLAMISGAVGDRIWFHRVKDRPLYPNLYTLLVGDSGSGKGMAARQMEDFVEDIPVINYRRQKVTAQYLLDMLGKPAIDINTGQKILKNPRVFLSMPELSSYFHKGDHGEALIQMLTELYGGVATFADGTRMHGSTVVENPCINWYAGSTPEWLLKTVSPESILSGFFARMLIVYPESPVNKTKKLNQEWDNIMYPDDFDEVKEHIKARVQMLSMMEGEMRMTNDANNYMRQWLYNREEPHDDMLMPSWKRHREQAAKIAMLLSLSDMVGPVIELTHAQRAVNLVESLSNNLWDLIEFSQHNPLTKNKMLVKAAIKKHGRIQGFRLTKLMQHYMNGPDVTKSVNFLKQECCVLEEITDTGGRLYCWVDPTVVE